MYLSGLYTYMLCINIVGNDKTYKQNHQGLRVMINMENVSRKYPASDTLWWRQNENNFLDLRVCNWKLRILAARKKSFVTDVQLLVVCLESESWRSFFWLDPHCCYKSETKFFIWNNNTWFWSGKIHIYIYI